MALKRVPAIKEVVLKVKGGRSAPKLKDLQLQLEKAFNRLGCRACLSGLNRLIIEDPLAGGIR